MRHCVAHPTFVSPKIYQRSSARVPTTTDAPSHFDLGVLGARLPGQEADEHLRGTAHHARLLARLRDKLSDLVRRDLTSVHVHDVGTRIRDGDTEVGAGADETHDRVLGVEDGEVRGVLEDEDSPALNASVKAARRGGWDAPAIDPHRREELLSTEVPRSVHGGHLPAHTTRSIQAHRRRGRTHFL